MTTLLQINASLNSGDGQSSQLANQFVAGFHKRQPEAKIIVRAVAAGDPVPHLNAERFGAFIAGASRLLPLSSMLQFWPVQAGDGTARHRR